MLKEPFFAKKAQAIIGVLEMLFGFSILYFEEHYATGIFIMVFAFYTITSSIGASYYHQLWNYFNYKKIM